MVYQIEGTRFSNLEEFFAEFSDVVIPQQTWGRNLDAFNDILRGGFGTPPEGFTIRWKNHQISKQRLGYPETVRQLEFWLQRCHPDSREKVARDLETARQQKGPTVFDWLVDIIRIHGKGGPEENDSVQLLLD